MKVTVTAGSLWLINWYLILKYELSVNQLEDIGRWNRSLICVHQNKVV